MAVRFDALWTHAKRVRGVINDHHAMGAGMLPIAIGFGAAEPSFRSPMSSP